MGEFVLTPTSMGQIKERLNILFNPANIKATAAICRNLQLFYQGADMGDASKELSVVPGNNPDKDGWQRFLSKFLFVDNAELHNAARGALLSAVTVNPPMPVTFLHAPNSKQIGLHLRRFVEKIDGKPVTFLEITYEGPAPGEPFVPPASGKPKPGKPGKKAPKGGKGSQKPVKKRAKKKKA